MGDGMGWVAGRAGVRWRSTVVATIVLAVALVGAGVILLVLLNHSLVAGVTDSARSKAMIVSAQLAAGGASALNPGLLATSGEATVLQVLRPDGRVLLSSPDIEGEPPIVAPRTPGGGELVRTVPLSLGSDNADYRVVAVGGTGAGAAYTVVAAQSLGSARQAVAQLGLLLAASLLPLLTVAGLAVHLALGAALRPVEAMRRAVADISTTDMTARVSLPPARDEIHRLASTLNAMLDRLASAQAAQRQFVADASHELRSPLATIAASLDLATHHPETITMTELIDAVGAETSRFREIVEDLLVLARTDDASDAPPRVEVDLDDVVRAEAERLRAATTLDVEVHAHPAKTQGNPTQLARAVRNLADNARDHARGRVLLRSALENGRAVIEVRDDGLGIAPADRTRIFGRFVRLEAGRSRSHGGTGLGLAIVAGIATRHGGTAACLEPQRGQPGACFRLEFPAVVDNMPHGGVDAVGTTRPGAGRPARELGG